MENQKLRKEARVMKAYLISNVEKIQAMTELQEEQESSLVEKQEKTKDEDPTKILDQLTNESLMKKYEDLCQKLCDQQQLLAINQEPTDLLQNADAYLCPMQGSKFEFLNRLTINKQFCIRCIDKSTTLIQEIEQFKKKNGDSSYCDDLMLPRYVQGVPEEPIEEDAPDDAPKAMKIEQLPKFSKKFD